MWLYIWLGVAAAALVIEFLTSELVSVWFAGGGIVAMVLAGAGLDWYFHVPAFFVVSLLLMLSLRKLVMSKLNNKTEKTNAESVIGKEFILLTPISFNTAGSIKVGDVIWTADTENDGDEIPAGATVIVQAIKGNKYIVTEVQK